MMFRKKNPNIIDGTTLEFPRSGFWVVHALGVAGLIYLGAKLGKCRR